MLQTKRTIDTPLLTDFPEGSTPKEIGKRLGKLLQRGNIMGKLSVIRKLLLGTEH